MPLAAGTGHQDISVLWLELLDVEAGRSRPTSPDKP